MDFHEIMESITAGLTGDFQKDYEYLTAVCEKYDDTEYSAEVRHACGRILRERMPEDMWKEFEQRIDNYLLSIKAVIEEAEFNRFKGRCDVAESILRGMIEKIEKAKAQHFLQDEADSERYSFSSSIEFCLYIHHNKPEKRVHDIPLPLAHLYLSYGSVLFDLKEFDRAREALAKARSWNPVSPDITFEYAELFKLSRDWDTYWQLTRGGFKYAYKSDHLARCYRNLGYYFIEKELWKEAMACYLLSLGYSDESSCKVAMNEMDYIKSKAGDTFEPPTIKEIAAYAHQYDFPLGPDQDVIGVAVIYGQQCLESGEMDFAKYFWGIAYDLTKKEEIKEAIENIG